jgi:glycosyltransferase involved in cell wall biosynthesis
VHETWQIIAKHHQVTVLTGSYPGSRDTIRDGVTYKRIGFSFGNPKVDQVLYQLALVFHVLTKKFDLWFESFTPPFSTSFLPWFTKKPVVGITHLLGGKEMSEKYHLPFELLQSFGLRQYKHIVVLSAFLQKQIVEAVSKAQTYIIPNGLSASALSRQIDKQEKHILFLGRLDIFHKGLDVLLRAYKQAADKLPYKLLLAGSGQKHEVKRVTQMIAKLNLEDRVKLLGKVHDEAKWQLFDHAVFTVIPSRVEGFAIVALEAMLCKSPLIISSIQGLGWIPDSAAIRVPSFDPKEFSEAMVGLASNEQKRAEMGLAGRAVAAEYTWQKVADSYEDIIKNLVPDKDS